MPVCSIQHHAHTGTHNGDNSPEDDLEADDAHLEAHGSSIQIALCTDCKLPEALDVRDDAPYDVQADLPQLLSSVFVFDFFVIIYED